jgi:hypothetical protein
VRIVPQSVDDWPVGIVWWNGSVADAGNAEAERHEVIVRVYDTAGEEFSELRQLVWEP